jgi:alpha-galactosidase
MFKFATLTALIVSNVEAAIQKTPAMGYIAATNEGCWVNTGILKLQADYIQHIGLAKKGYTYFVVDDCW